MEQAVDSETIKRLVRGFCWLILGAVYGTAVGVFSRRLGLFELTGGLLGGMIAAPLMVMMLLLIDYWRQLVIWAVYGAIVGAAGFIIIWFVADQALGHYLLTGDLTTGRVISGALVGAATGTWIGAGTAVFQRGTLGLIGMLSALIAGAFLGAVVWMVGNAIGGRAVIVEIGSYVAMWKLGETVAGIPLGVVVGIATTQVLFKHRL